MTANVPAAFYSHCQRLGVQEGDYLYLEYLGINTASSFFFKVPSEQALEKFLQEKLFTSTGVRDPYTFVVSADARTDGGSWEDFSVSDAVSAVRHLWHLSKSSSMSDLTRAAGDLTDSRKTVLTTTVIEDLFERARIRGLDDSNPNSRPANLIVSKSYQNYSIGGRFSYLYFEQFITQEDEERAREQGLLASQVGHELVPSASPGKFDYTPGAAPQLQQPWIEDRLKLQKCMKLKEFTFDVAEICPHEVLHVLHEVETAALDITVLMGCRAPSIPEIKYFDRLVHNEMNKFLARGKGNVQTGIEFMLSDGGRLDAKFKLLEQVDSEKADRGLAQPLQDRALIVTTSDRAPNKHNSEMQTRTRSRSPKRGNPGKGQQVKGGKTCFYCTRPRSEHPGNKFDECNRKAAAQQGGTQPQQSQASGSGSPKGKKGKGKGGGSSKGQSNSNNAGVPVSMKKDCAHRSPPTRQFPDGLRFCFNHHRESSNCDKGDACPLSHGCPRYMPSGMVCMSTTHRAYGHDG